ncbi:MAG: BlaI/MecI/CopY family transcriptional regulator [Candidatus Kerfeldbacteria bacterium]|nr:BlaI/MecI/CopY family transcriptional regulator [Candidatus Kerfeldbacteria bacterium]
MVYRKTIFGRLKQAIMDVAWQQGSVTVRQVLGFLRPRHRVAYTTVMTVMNRLTEQGWLKRRPTTSGAFRYAPTQSREAHAQAATRQEITTLIRQYGDLALAQFLSTVDRIPAAKAQRLRHRLRTDRQP